MPKINVIQRPTSILCLCLLATFFAASCSSDSHYEGRVIEVDYRDIEDIGDQAWIEVDGIRYTHYENFEKAYQDEYSLPASKEVYYVVRGDEKKKRFSPNSDFTIAIALGNFIDYVHSHRDTTLARVKLNQRYLMHTFGRLILQRPDSNAFVVRTSSGYPADITVKAP